jgi:raffinose/stachyose/melibiose transport system substrate-binding protein
VHKGLINSDALTATYDSATSAIASGRCGAIINGTWAIGAIGAIDKSSDLGLFPLPAANGTGAIGLSKPNLLKIAPFSKVAAAAQDFLNFMVAQPQAQKFLNANPGVSAFTDVKVADSSSAVADVQKLVDAGGTVVPFDQQSTLPQPQDDIIAAYQELIGKRIDVAGFGKRVQSAWAGAGAKAGAPGF